MKGYRRWFVIGAALAALLLVLAACEQGPVDPPEPPEPPPGEQAVAAINEARQGHDGAAERFKATDANAPLADRVRTVAEGLAELPTVTRATASVDTIQMTHTSGLQTVMLFLEHGSGRRGPQPTAARVATTDASPASPALGDTDATYLPASNGASLVFNDKVLICAPLDHNDREPVYAETGEAVAQILRTAPERMPRFNITYLPYQECTIEELLKINDYGTIVFSSHGSGARFIHLDEHIDEEHARRYEDLYLGDPLLLISSTFITYPNENRFEQVYTPVLTPEFFRRYLKPVTASNRGRVILTAACTTTEQLPAGDLEDALSAVGVHVGYDGLVADVFADDTTKQFFTSMMAGQTARAAYQALPTKVFYGIGIDIYGHDQRYEPLPLTWEGSVADQEYTVGTQIEPLILPAATGSSLFNYWLSPDVPGLIWQPSARTLSGTPTTEGTYRMRYTALVGPGPEGISASFTITVREPEPRSCEPYAPNPPIGATGVSVDHSFKWSRGVCGGTVRYEVNIYKFDTLPPSGPLGTPYDRVRADDWRMPLEPNTVYEWYVETLQRRGSRFNIRSYLHDQRWTFSTGPRVVPIPPPFGHIYWVGENHVARANVDGSARKTIISRLRLIDGLTIDSPTGKPAIADGKIYWTSSKSSIYRTNVYSPHTVKGSPAYALSSFATGQIEGQRAEKVLSEPQGTLSGIAVSGGKIYWVNNDSPYVTVKRANLDGRGRETLIKSERITVGHSHWIYGIAVSSGKMYWMLSGSSNTSTGASFRKIERANLDGSGRETVIDFQGAFPGDVAVFDGKVYWTRRGVGVERANLDGTGRETLITTTDIPGSIAFYGGKLYWAHSGKIERANLDGSGRETLFSGHIGGIAIAPCDGCRW